MAGGEKPPREELVGPGWRPWLGAAAIVVLVALVYWPTLRNGFVSDDKGYVVYNYALHTARGLYDIWFTIGTIQQYYPLVFTGFWVEYHLWGLHPLGYHAVNAALHAAAAVLAWRLLVRLEVPGAWLAAAIFAVHPVEVESVAWVSERKNVLSCVLALGSLLAYLRFSPAESAGSTARSQSARWRWLYYALALVLYVGALLSKSVTASVPAVILVIYWWKRGRLRWRDGVPLAPFFAVGLGLSLLTIHMERVYVGAEGEEWDFSFIDRLLIAGRAVWFYAGKLVWPYPLMFFYPRWTIDAGVWWQYLYPLAALALLVGLWWARKWIGRGPLAAALIFGGVLVPALGFFDVFPFRFSFVADHYQYHASLALIALGAAAIAVAWRRLALAPWMGVAAGALLLTPLVVLAHRKTYVYWDNYSLHEDITRYDPQSWVAYNNLAGCLLSEKKYDEAIAALRKTIALVPEDPVPRANLSWALFEMGRYDEALAELHRAQACESNDYERSWQLRLIGTIQTEQNQLDEAMENLNRSIEIWPDWRAYLQRGRLWAIKGRYDKALRDLENARRQEPLSVEVLEMHAQVLAAAGQHPEALATLEQLRKMVPDNPSLLMLTAAMYLACGQHRDALTLYNQVLNEGTANADAYRGRANAYLHLGEHKHAIDDYRAVLKLSPDDIDASNNLAWLLATSPYASLRDGRRAIELARQACEATDYKRPDLLSTLAAGWAEVGDFKQAVKWSQAAIAISDEPLKAEITRQLRSYQYLRPWREDSPSAQPANRRRATSQSAAVSDS